MKYKILKGKRITFGEKEKGVRVCFSLPLKGGFWAKELRDQGGQVVISEKIWRLFGGPLYVRLCKKYLKAKKSEAVKC